MSYRIIFHFRVNYQVSRGLPGGSVGKESVCNAGDAGNKGLILGREGTLEKEMAPHSSVLAWKLAWTEEPGGLQFMGSHRVRHTGSDFARCQIFDFSS